MIIQHNMMAMNTARQLGIATKAKAKRTERLSSGYRINRAADDAASLAISEKMRAQIRGLQKGSQNVQDAISFCNVAEGALNEVHDILGRIKELAVQAASDTYVLEDREAIDAEFAQLKDEINRISRTTEFNTMRIFDDGRFEVEFTDDVCPIKIYNATIGHPGDPDTYGGVIVGEDVRIAWKTIDPSMVTKDPDTGETVFKAGEYKYETKYYDFTITCEDGSKPPEIKVEFEVSASGNGIHIAGDTIRWEDVVNENDECILDHLGEEGNYHFRGRSSNGGLYVEEGALLSDIIKELNRYNEDSHRRYYSVYSGYKEEQAVTVDECLSKVQITQHGYDTYIKNNTVLDTQVQVKADEDAVWLVDKDGNELTDSRKTWKDLKLEHWDSTNDVSDTKVYTYSYDNTQDGVDDSIEVKLEFSFLLLDETSKQSVIDGLNNMDLSEGRYIPSNKTTVDVTTGGNVLSATVTRNNNILTVEEEGMLGRDFEQQIQEFVTNAVAQPDAQSNTYKVEFGSGSDTLTYLLSTNTSPTTLSAAVPTATIKYIEAKAVREELGGTAATAAHTLESVVGTCPDTLSDTLVFDAAQMTTTNSLTDGTAYAAATLDFSGLDSNQYELYDLLGTGFSFTDATGSNNYNVVFSYGDSYENVNGYGHTTYRNPSTVCVDLKTFMDKGVSTGAELADALRQIMDANGFDNGSMQYVTDNSGKLYLCDNRSQYAGAGQGKFEAEPVVKAEVGVTTRLSNGGRYVDVYYRYDIMDALKAEAVTKTDANGNPYVDVGIKWQDAYDTMMAELTANTKYSIEATDYAYCDCTVYENPNKAYVSTFRFQIEEEKDEGMWIQAGPNTYQGMFMKWDGFSDRTLGLTRLSMTNREEASTLLRRVDNATEKISGIRSAFGAYTNRLEKAYNMNENYRENVQAAESKLRDADMAAEVLENAKAGILEQVAQSMLSQANQSTQGILSLLQG